LATPGSWNPKFRKLRAQKTVKLDLPDFDKLKFGQSKSETKEEMRSRRIKEGFEPPVGFEYKPLNFASSNEVFDGYIPPENDGKSSSLLDRGKELFELGKKRTVDKVWNRHKSKIKSHVSTFSEDSFLQQAEEIYKDAHLALMKRDKEKLLDLVTEHAYAKMWTNMKFKTLKWELVEVISPPRISQLTTREMSSKKEVFGQITVRFHTQQILAIYDRFGRLALGSEKLPKDVLEYVVFERYLTNFYSSWRMHEKIEPVWLPPKQEILRSYVMPKLFKIDEMLDAPESKFKKDEAIEETEQPKTLASN
jgi:large subunit ribosomal protein L45